MATIEKGVTARPAASAILTIDSEDRYKNYEDAQINVLSTTSNNTPYNFQIAGERSLLAGFMTRIGVTEINYAWCHPNISNKTNKIGFSIQQIAGGATTYYVAEIPIGFYRPVDLAAAIQAEIRSLTAAVVGDGTLTTANFTFTYGFNNNPVFFGNINNPLFNYAFLPMPYNSTQYPYSNNCRQLIDVLGFSWVGPSYPLPTYISSGGGGYSLAQSIRYVDIVCHQLSGKQGLGDGTSQQLGRDAICRIYVGESTNNTQSPNDATFTPPGTVPFVIHRLFPVPKMMNWDARTNIGTSLRFQVYDDEGDLIDTSTIDGRKQQTMNWSMTLLATEN